MNHPFIELMCESYYNDKSLGQNKLFSNKPKILKEMNLYIIGLMNELKLQEESLFFEMHVNLDKRQQQQIIYILLNDLFAEHYNFGDHQFKDNYDSPEEFVQESLALIGTGLGNILGGIGGAAGGAAQFAIGAVSSLASLTTLGLLILAVIVFYKRISRHGWNILSKLNAANKVVAYLVHNATKSGKVKNAILVNNLDLCFKKCNIDPNKVHAMAGFAFGKSRMPIPKDAVEQAHCLSVCYLQWTLDNVSLIAKVYVECLKSSGQKFDALNDMNLFLTAPLPVCQEYYNILKRHRDEYLDAVDIIFDDATSTKEAWKREYDKMITMSLTGPNKYKFDSSHQQSSQQTTQKPYQKPNYQNNPKR